MFPLFWSKLRQHSSAFIHQKTSGIHFIRRLLCFPFLIPTDWSVFLVFFSACWLGMRAHPSVARGLPDWLDSFRGKRAECFWGLEFECETLGDAAAFPAKNTHFEEFAHFRRAQSFWVFFARVEGKRFTEMQNDCLQVLLYRAWGYSHKTAP